MDDRRARALPTDDGSDKDDEFEDSESFRTGGRGREEGAEVGDADVGSRYAGPSAGVDRPLDEAAPAAALARRCASLSFEEKPEEGVWMVGTCGTWLGLGTRVDAEDDALSGTEERLDGSSVSSFSSERGKSMGR